MTQPNSPRQPLTDLEIAGIEQRVSDALSEMVLLCDPPKEKLEKISDLARMILGEIDSLRSES